MIRSVEVKSSRGEWHVAPGDPTYAFDPKSSKPIFCHSKARAAFVVAAVNAYLRKGFAP